MKLVSGEFPKTIWQTEQAKHVPGVVWEAEKAAGNMKSVFYPEVDVQGLVDKYLGTGKADRSPHNVWHSSSRWIMRLGNSTINFKGAISLRVASQYAFPKGDCTPSQRIN